VFLSQIHTNPIAASVNGIEISIQIAVESIGRSVGLYIGVVAKDYRSREFVFGDLGLQRKKRASP
jgi:hypothetical protein